MNSNGLSEPDIKNPTQSPSVLRNPTPTPPKNLRLFATLAPTPQPWSLHHHSNSRDKILG